MLRSKDPAGFIHLSLWIPITLLLAADLMGAVRLPQPREAQAALDVPVHVVARRK